MAANFAFTYTPPGGSAFTFGAGTSIGINSATGLDDLPDLRTTDDTRGYADGEFYGRDFMAGRSLTFQLEFYSDNTPGLAYTNLDAFKTATAPQQSGAGVLQLQLPGQPYKRINCRPRKRNVPLVEDYEAQLITAAVEFWAADPRVYADAASSVIVTLPSTTSGFTFPLTLPLTFGAASGGNTAAVTNAGSTTTYPTFTITGPVTNPSIALQETGQTLSFNITLNTGDTLTVDTDLKTVVLNGTASRRSTLNAGSAWFGLPPGTSHVQFNASAFTASQLTAAYRSAWV